MYLGVLGDGARAQRRVVQQNGNEELINCNKQRTRRRRKARATLGALRQTLSYPPTLLTCEMGRVASDIMTEDAI
jgi:hypothetical protein